MGKIHECPKRGLEGWDKEDKHTKPLREEGIGYS